MHCQRRGEERRGEERRAHSPAAHLTVSEALSPADPKTHNGLSRPKIKLLLQLTGPGPNSSRSRQQLPGAQTPGGRPLSTTTPPRARGPAVRVVGRPLSLTCRCQQQPTNPLRCLHARERDHVRQSIFSVRPLARTRGARRGGAATAQCRRPRPRAEPRETRCLMPGRA
jgi:hypothetical protein